MSIKNYDTMKITISLCLCIFLFNSIFFPCLQAGDSPEEKWLDAVSKGESGKAIKIANQMVPQHSLKGTINPKYTALAEQEKVGQKFLVAPFNELDFRLWYDAWFLKQMAEQAKAKFKTSDENFDRNVINVLFNTVVKNIKSKEENKGLIPWPTGVWRRKYGLCDRQSWLLAELLYQAGFETQIVYLINPKTGKSPHTICEILRNDEKGNAVHTTADPFSKVLLCKMSVNELNHDKILMQKIWPEREDWWDSLGSSIFWTHSYPQDYCGKNQELYRKLKEKLGNRCPRFGEDPITRLRFYNKSGKNKSFKTALWFYPFRLLKIEMDIQEKIHKKNIDKQKNNN